MSGSFLVRGRSLKLVSVSSFEARSLWHKSPCRSITLTSSSRSSLKSDIPSYKRVGQTFSYPNEYPGQIYAFNWSLNGDGVTPLKRCAFQIKKPLDLKIAGLVPLANSPLKVTPASPSTIPEAGTDELTFDKFDEVSQKTRDLLSLSDRLYCPEGHVPGTRTSVRFITNSATLAPMMMAYLDRSPKQERPLRQSITCYILETSEEEGFAGHAIEEVEDFIQEDWKEDFDWVPTNKMRPLKTEIKSIASVIVVGDKPDLSVIVAGVELCQKALAADEIERKSKDLSNSKK